MNILSNSDPRICGMRIAVKVSFVADACVRLQVAGTLLWPFALTSEIGA